ncbi:MAG: acylphosphatase [Alphaproteobacteria bacterium]
MTADAAAPATVRVRIAGKVQGVWYRGWTVETARSLGVGGWVRNRADGTVEALLHGPEAAVEKMIEACRVGPPAARVTDVARFVTEAGGEDLAGGFSQRPTE